ncbi:conditioned medium-induced protein 4 [Haloplanus salilacus]|uniref:conditioned medium-induced protein 4 n=1 Tax=Haloplanus salilacus TaxID=2949994 RepID=UPI0030D3D6CC
MDEKTSELRDIFVDATGTETVTERQAERRGSITEREAPEEVAAEVDDLVATMRERYDFRTDLDAEAYRRLVRGFHDDADDAALAEALDIPVETVVDARLDLHLVRDADRDVPNFEAIRDRIVDGADDDAIADDLGDAETLAHVRRVVESEREATRANGRFRDAFAELLTDADLTGRLASDSREDGLEEATEDIETDVSL